MPTKILLSTLTVCLLAACGGGSDNNSNPQITPETPGNTLNKNNTQPQAITRLTADYSVEKNYVWGVFHEGYDTFTLKVGGKTLAKEVRNEKKRTLDLSVVPLGFHALTAENQYTGSNKAAYKSDVTLRSYRGYYAGTYAYGKDGSENPLDDDFEVYLLPTVTLPSSGIATYAGKVFDDRPINDADLTYRIDFGKKKGSGTVAATSRHPELTLQEASITHYASPFDHAYGVKEGSLEHVHSFCCKLSA